jgi:hypothetical protein
MAISVMTSFYLTTPVQVQTLGHTLSTERSTLNGEFKRMMKEATTANSKALFLHFLQRKKDVKYIPIVGPQVKIRSLNNKEART